MPRPARLLLSKSYYHVMTRGNNKNIVFKDESDYHYYLKLIDKYKEELPFELYHYCLMPNHIHMLIQTKQASDFSLFMKKLNLAYFHYFRKKYGWVGHFWQDRFKSQAVEKDNYFIQCGKYIELNPVRAKLVKDPTIYPYSSYNHYALGYANKLITKDFIYDELGKNDKEKQKNYQKLVISEIVIDNRSNNTKNVWGSDYQRYRETRKMNYNL